MMFKPREGFTRRELLKCAGLGVGTLLTSVPLLSLERLAEPAGRTRVVVARDSALIEGPCGKIDSVRTASMLDEAVRRLADDKDAATAWQRLFRPTDVVGVKVNCLSGPRMSTRQEVVAAIVDGLRRAGVAESRIIVWDKDDTDLKRAGYTVARGRGPSVYGTIGGQFSPGYEDGVRFAGEHVGSCFSRILTEQVTALVNVPVLKDHDIAGVTLGLKNWFGAIHNPNKYHDTLCDPYVAELSTHPSIRRKLRLVVVDATTVQYDGGPGARPDRGLAFGGLLVGADPVAVDACGVNLIEEERKRAGLPSLEAAGRPPRHLETAGRLGLGERELTRLDVVNL
jgi:uncharacterized protein (DUF362 family)